MDTIAPKVRFFFAYIEKTYFFLAYLQKNYYLCTLNVKKCA